MTVDGHKARGAATRQAIVDGALTVVAAEGVEGLSHRAVAAQAGVSLASTTYHFASLGDLYLAVFAESARRVRDDQLALRERVTAHEVDPADACVDLILHQIGPGREATVTLIGMLQWASRRSDAKPLVQAWRRELGDTLLPVYRDEARARGVALGIRGLVADALLADPPPTRAELAPVVRAILFGNSAPPPSH
jgi:DNA-binding transcriptional regulator YbjK